MNIKRNQILVLGLAFLAFIILLLFNFNNKQQTSEQVAKQELQEFKQAKTIFCQYYDAVIAKDAKKASKMIYWSKSYSQYKKVHSQWVQNSPVKDYQIISFTKEKNRLYKAIFNLNFSRNVHDQMSDNNVSNYVQKIDGKLYMVLLEEEIQ